MNINDLAKQIKKQLAPTYETILLIKRCLKDGIITKQEYCKIMDKYGDVDKLNYPLSLIGEIKNNSMKYSYQLVNQGFYCRICKNDKDTYLRKVNNQLVYHCDRCKRRGI